MAFLNVKILKSDSEKLNELQIKNNRKLEALTRNSEVAIAMGMMENLNNKYQQWQQELHNAEKKLKTKTKTISTIVKNLRYIIQISITFVSAILIIKGKMSSGGMIAISTLSSKVLAPFDASATIFQAITSIKKSYQRLSNVIKSDNSENRIELPTPNGDIDFENVTFLPIGSSSPIINNISFKVLSGEIIGIIGKSGSGKTTLARLLAGIIEPNRGKVKLDSAPLNFWNKNSLGKFIGYLPQDIELFQASIKDNVSRMDSNAKDEEVIKAAKQAGVHELILSFNNGYETEIGLTNISAGQRQRIGLARCFYEQPKVIILDEPNSNLDIEGENFLMNAINIAKSNKTTVFIISHKPSILKVVDKIMVIGDGELKAFEVKEKIMQNFVVDNEKNKKY
jgi:PrtD family type I secretion system ABC transporter